MQMHWITYLYQFGIGGIAFVLGLWLILKSKACDLKSAGDRIWFWALIVGYAGLAGVFLLWTLVAVHS